MPTSPRQIWQDLAAAADNAYARNSPEETSLYYSSTQTTFLSMHGLLVKYGLIVEAEGRNVDLASGIAKGIFELQPRVSMIRNEGERAKSSAGVGVAATIDDPRFVNLDIIEELHSLNMDIFRAIIHVMVSEVRELERQLGKRFARKWLEQNFPKLQAAVDELTPRNLEVSDFLRSTALWRGPFAHGLEEYIEAQDRIHPDRFVGFLAQRARWIEYVWVFAWLLIGVLSMFALPFIIRLVEWPR